MDELLVVLKNCYDEGLHPLVIIAVITDGEDNSSKVDSSVVKEMIKELKDKKYLINSVAVGFPEDINILNEATLETIKETIGFDQSLAFGKASLKDIRISLENFSSDFMQ